MQTVVREFRNYDGTDSTTATLFAKPFHRRCIWCLGTFRPPLLSCSVISAQIDHSMSPCVLSPPLETPGRIEADPTRIGWLDLSRCRPPTVRCPRRPFLRVLGRAIGMNWSISVETITRHLLFGMSSLEFMRNSRFRSLFLIWFWFFEGLCWEGWGCPVLRVCGS